MNTKRAAAGGGWSSLPADLLDDVSRRLSADADYLHIHQVCAHWRASTSPLAASRPWIVAGREPWQKIGPIGEYSFRLLHGGGRSISPRAPPAGLPHCCGVPRGWLALADRDDARLVLWEPLSGTEIELPRLHAVAQVFLSADPLASCIRRSTVRERATTGERIRGFVSEGHALTTEQ